MPSHNIEVVGIASDFFVTEEGSWIKTYDEDCKRISQMWGRLCPDFSTCPVPVKSGVIPLL